MNKKLSITLLVAMLSLLIIGFGGAATAEAAGKCAETLLVNVSASESTAFTDCRALQADAARYTGLAASYTNETNNVQRALEADAARYTGLAAFYTNGTNGQRALEADAARYTGLAAFYTAESAEKCLGIGSTDMTAVELVNCLSDSAYQAANPELMASHRFVVADGSAASQPASSDSAYQAANPELMASHRFVVADGSATSQPASVDIEVLRNNYYNNILAASYGDSAVEPVNIKVQQSLILNPNLVHPGR